MARFNSKRTTALVLLHAGMTLFSLLFIPGLKAQTTFTANNVVVLQVASNTSNNTTGSILEFNTTSANQSTAVSTNAIPGTVGNANSIRFSGSATSTGYLANSNDGSLLLFTGGDTTSTLNLNTVRIRKVGTMNNSATYNVATTYIGANGNQTRGATTVNNTALFAGDQGGIFRNLATTATPTGNVRSIRSFGGNVFFLNSRTTFPAVLSYNTATSDTLVIPGLPILTPAPVDFLSCFFRFKRNFL